MLTIPVLTVSPECLVKIIVFAHVFGEEIDFLEAVDNNNILKVSQSVVSQSFSLLRREKDFYDVTLVSHDETQIPAASCQPPVHSSNQFSRETLRTYAGIDGVGNWEGDYSEQTDSLDVCREQPSGYHLHLTLKIKHQKAKTYSPQFGNLV